MDLDTAFRLIFSVFAIFSIIILVTRVFGLRTFAKMSSFDFASTIAVGSVLASVILNKDNSILQGSIILFCIVGFQTIFSLLVRKSLFFKQCFTNKPKLLIWEGKVLYNNLKKANVGEDDLLAKLREANVFKFSEVKAVVFESTGDISVLHNNSDTYFDEKILGGVDLSGAEIETF